MIFQLKKLSLRNRIFLSMILLVLLASILILVVTIFQYDEQTQDYNIKRFERKESTTKKHIELELAKTTYPVDTEYLSAIFRNSINEISSINRLNISVFDLKGNLLKSSTENAFEKLKIKPLSNEILSKLAKNSSHRVMKNIVNVDENDNDLTYQTSYTYLKDSKFKRIGILELQFAQDNSEIKHELREFISRLSIVYLLMFAIAIALAYFLSSYITRSIKTISEKMKQTRLNKRNEKITLDGASSEIENLVVAYNNMIDQLEESAVKLAKSEREQAWREMAKQVAHEIKNPLTPMRLTVQSFERRFNAKEENAKEKLKEFSETLIQQIDVMSSIASAFSDFAKMPTQKKEKIEVIGVVKMALDIFAENYITYSPKEEALYANLDKTQLIRIVTNLVTNAIQASENRKEPIIEVKVAEEKNNIKIVVTDNGKGVAENVKHLVFEPKFTTKTSGMGLGLPMIKNIIEAYDGSISFSSAENVGTSFTVILPKL